MASIHTQMWRAGVTVLLLCISISRPVLAQDAAKNLDDQLTVSRLGYRATKAVTAMGTYAVAREIGLSRPLSAGVGAVTPLVIGKVLYLAQGSPSGRWPNAGFLIKDVASELAEGSAPIWMTWARNGGKQQWWRWPIAVVGYGTSVWATWDWGTP